MQQPVCKLLFQGLDAANWESVPPPVAAHLRLAFSFGSTKICEDAFQRLRVQEQRGQSNQKVRLARVWHTLVAKQLLGRIHGFCEVDYQAVGLKRYYEDLPKEPARGVYRQKGHKPVLPLHTVTGDTPEARRLISPLW